ncbi:MAG TPA: hypothetical protein VGF92_04590 [Stellaceae bacterium]|jgi:hypothetical protein
MNRLFPIAILVAALPMVGCEVRPVTQTNKAPDYTTQPRNLVLVPAIAGGLPSDQVDLFETEFTTSLEVCGVRVTATPAAGVPNPYVIAAATRDSGGGATKVDAVLVVQTTQTGTSNGVKTSLGYSASLDDLGTKKTVWKAVVNMHWDSLLSDHSALGRDLATAVVAAMRRDGLLPTQCAAAK